MSFLICHKWLQKKFSELGRDKTSYQIAALLHIYIGTLTLEDIADRSGLSIDILRRLRANARFMHMVDTFKKDCTKEFREDLMINNYSSKEYCSIAAEYSMLDEVGRMQIRVPLLKQLRDLSQSIKSRSTYHIKIDTYELMLFMRLFSFFIFTEKYIHTLTSKSLADMKKIAEEVVWPALNLDINEIDRILQTPSETKGKLAEELRTALDKLF